jgi:hypothetical protein
MSPSTIPKIDARLVNIAVVLLFVYGEISPSMQYTPTRSHRQRESYFGMYASYCGLLTLLHHALPAITAFGKKQKLIYRVSGHMWSYFHVFSNVWHIIVALSAEYDWEDSCGF